jgi:hypothetical protein
MDNSDRLTKKNLLLYALYLNNLGREDCVRQKEYIGNYYSRKSVVQSQASWCDLQTDLTQITFLIS